MPPCLAAASMGLGLVINVGLTKSVHLWLTQRQEPAMMRVRLKADGRLVEIVELKNHPWFLATQFHPEYRSRPHHPHPLFSGFVGAALRKKLGH